VSSRISSASSTKYAAAPSHSLTASTNSGAGAALVANVRIVKTAFCATAVWTVLFRDVDRVRSSTLVGRMMGRRWVVLKATVQGVWWPIRLCLLADDDVRTAAQIERPRCRTRLR